MYLVNQFSDKLQKLGISREIYIEVFKNLADTLDYKDFDNGFLKPESLERLCKQLNIKPNQLYDDYYSFIFSDYGKTLIRLRKETGLNQKHLASKLHISPVDLSCFEKGQKYPARGQFEKICNTLFRKDDFKCKEI